VSNNIVGIIGPGGEGGTFLDWTLHYLSGDSRIKYILVDRYSHRVIKVRSLEMLVNPITSVGNAHKHHKSHPTIKSIQSCIENYHSILDPSINIYTMYIVPDIESYENNSYTDVVRYVTNTHADLKLIHFIYPDQVIEDLVQRIKTKIPDNTESIEEIQNRVKIESSKDNKIIDKPNVYSLGIEQMFYDLDSVIEKIFDWLKIPINHERYESWLAVYKQWQLAQNFCTKNTVVL